MLENEIGMGSMPKPEPECFFFRLFMPTIGPGSFVTFSRLGQRALPRSASPIMGCDLMSLHLLGPRRGKTMNERYE
jgi:hypothetical protein